MTKEELLKEVAESDYRKVQSRIKDAMFRNETFIECKTNGAPYQETYASEKTLEWLKEDGFVITRNENDMSDVTISW